MSHSHHRPIDFPESFHLRQPVLEAILPNHRWAVAADGKSIAFDLPAENYSTHEKDIIEFALNPHATATGIFAGLDKPVAHRLAAALSALFGSGGFYG